MKAKCAATLILTVALAVAACSKKEEAAGGAAGKKPKSTPITAIKAVSSNVSVTQEAIGLIESKAAPFVSAETAGRVEKILVDVGQKVALGQPLAELDKENLTIEKSAASADVSRLSALAANQEKTVERYAQLAKENFVNRAMVDDVQVQLKALQEQLVSARARLARVESDLAKTTITSPAGGRIEQRLVDVGDFVSVGRPVFRIAAAEFLRVVLPFPETVASSLATGQKVKLSSPSAPEITVDGMVAEIRPMISAGARAVELILDVPNPGGWKPGGTVKGVLTMEERQNAVMIPETCVVLRPAGAVAYVVEGGLAKQRVLKLGTRKDGLVEIISGVNDGQLVAMDGAAYLTDNAPVSVREEK
ncbi:MAG: efflux RND transporter periplasmic adaptor subunit [Nitrospinota bacterium]|nr:efflux RND transporter periplasmic adaptor subunit [Nitrospinota bacterium]